MAQQTLTETERDLVQKISGNPLDLMAGDLRGWLEDFILLLVGPQTRSQYIAGDLRIVISDLTAQTGEYVFEDDAGSWLYCNGVAVSRTTYADLFGMCGTSFGVGDGSTTFNVPDGRGRSMFMCGTNAAADLGDNDGIPETDRQAKHAHFHSLAGPSHTHGTGTLAVGVGTLAISPSSHDHTYVAPVGTNLVDGGSGFNAVNGSGAATTGSKSLSITGSPSISGSTASAGGGQVTGSIGSGTLEDAPAHLFIGSLLVRF